MREIENKLLKFLNNKRIEKKVKQETLRRKMIVHSTGKKGIKAGQFSEMLHGDRPFYFDYVCQMLENLDIAIYLDGSNLYEVEKNYDHARVLKERDFYKEKYDILKEILHEDAKKNSDIRKKKAR